MIRPPANSAETTWLLNSRRRLSITTSSSTPLTPIFQSCSRPPYQASRPERVRSGNHSWRGRTLAG